MTSDCIDFIDKDDAGSILLALLKQVANTARSDADEHFYEVRTRDRKERDVGFTCHCTGQQSLTSSRRSDQQHTFRNTSAQLLELLRLTQELDDFAQLLFGFIHASYVFERDLFLLHGKQARAALAE